MSAGLSRLSPRAGARDRCQLFPRFTLSRARVRERERERSLSAFFGRAPPRNRVIILVFEDGRHLVRPLRGDSIPETRGRRARAGRLARSPCIPPVREGFQNQGRKSRDKARRNYPQLTAPSRVTRTSLWRRRGAARGRARG